MDKEFTINLVSNASMGMYPGNTMSLFTTCLPQSIEFSGTWKVALTEIDYPAKVKNVTNGYIRHNYGHGDRIHCAHIKTGCYTSVDALMKEIHNTVYGNPAKTKFKKSMTWWVDGQTQKLMIGFDQSSRGWISLESPDLRAILGYEDPIFQVDKDHTKPLESKYPADLQAGRHMMFVYCDLVEGEILGDQKTPLLRAIPLQINSSAAAAAASFIRREQQPRSSVQEAVNYYDSMEMLPETVHWDFTNLQFKTVAKSYFRTIRVDLRDERGCLLPFLGDARTHISLLFKKVM